MNSLKQIIQWFGQRRQYILIVLGITTTLISFWLFYINREDFSSLLYFQLCSLVTIIIVYLVQFTLDALSLWLLVNRFSKKQLPIINWIKIMFIGRMANFLLPKSGALYKAVVLKKDYSVKYKEFIYVYALFSWVTILINLGLATILVSLLMPDLKIGNFLATPIMVGIFIVTLVSPYAVERTFHFLNPQNTLLRNLYNSAHGFFKAMVTIGHDFKLMVTLIFLIIFIFGLNVILFQLIFIEMNVKISFAQIAFFIAVQQISILVYITPGNIGVRELLYGAVGGAIGIGIAEGVVASAILRAVMYIVVFPLGIVFGGLRLFRLEKQENSLKE